MTPPADPWRVDELVQWRMFFRGERETMPESKNYRAAVRKFQFPTQGMKLSATQLHVMAVAAARYLPEIPYRGPGSHREFIEDVERKAVNPNAASRKAWPESPYGAAIRAARRALYEVTREEGQQIFDEAGRKTERG